MQLFSDCKLLNLPDICESNRLRASPSFKVSYEIWISKSPFLEEIDEDTMVVNGEKLLDIGSLGF